jgi:hypothetical protein
MSDVFISYSHKDTDFVRDLVRFVEAEGFSVWWDHTIPPGKTWDDVIARGIREAKACIIIWSSDSVISDWVKEEATLAKEGGKYLPIQVGTDLPPMGFRRIQAANLSQWRGNAQDPQWRLLITEIAHLVGADGVAPPLPRPLTQYEKIARWLRVHQQRAVLLVFATIALVAVMTAVWWYAVASVPRQPIAAINTPAPEPAPSPTPSPSPSPSRAAQDTVDRAVVGTLTLDTVVADFTTHYVNQINSDGTFVLTGSQEEDGANAADANGNFRNVGLNTGRVHTGTVQLIDDTHFRANTSVYQLLKPVLPPGQPNPSLLGTWTTSGNVAGQQWRWTWTSTSPGSYHFEGHFADHGRAQFANGVWSATSLVTGLTGSGTYAMVDATHVLVNGVVWTKEQ